MKLLEDKIMNDIPTKQEIEAVESDLLTALKKAFQCNGFDSTVNCFTFFLETALETPDLGDAMAAFLCMICEKKKALDKAERKKEREK